MIVATARRILGIKRPSLPQEHVPVSRRPSYYLRRRGEQWLVVMCVGGEELELTPKEARLEANRLFQQAWLAANPGSCPQEIHG